MPDLRRIWSRERVVLGSCMEGQSVTSALHTVLLGHFAGLFAPLTTIRDAADLKRRLDAFGWDVDALTGVDVAGAVAAAQAARQAVDEVAQTVATGTGELAECAGALAKLAAATGRIIELFRGWTPPPGLIAADMALLAEDVLVGLVDTYLAGAAPRAAATLRVFGVVQDAPAAQRTRSDGTVVRRAMTRPAVDGAALRQLLLDPLGLLAARFRDDPSAARRTADQIADLAGPEIAAALASLGVPARYGVPGPGAGLGLTAEELAAARRTLVLEMLAGSDDQTGAVATRFRLAAGLTDDTAGRGLGLAVAPGGQLSITAAPLSVTLTGDLEPVLVTGGGVDFASAGSTSRLALTVAYAPAAPSGAPQVRLGAAAGTRLEVGVARAALLAELTPAGGDVGVAAELTGLLLAIAAGDGDGFLQKVLPSTPIAATADVVLDWSLRKGLRIRGTGSLELRVPAHLTLGPVRLEEIALGLTLADTGLAARVVVAATVALGPVVGTVSGIGLRAALAAPAGSPGDTDPSGLLSVGFQPPSGVGLSIDAAVVHGGGFILHEPERGRYVGILQLEIEDILAITAIGLLTTRMPDGSTGFSLLVIITAEFPPIQLGFGFTLTGLGGLAGVNRTMAVDALRAGVRNRALDSILFPRDPVANATKVVNDIESVFPAAPGRFVIGVMARLGWGSPPILTVDLGIVVELPAPIRIALLGRLTLVLPTEDAAVVELHMDVAGILDLGRQEASVDATLYDSRVAVFAISGDMAARLNWGAAPAFALSAGGFNPRFAPPPGFPELRRLAISLADGDNPRVRLEAYLATTSSTVQLGARLDVYAEVDAGLAGVFSASAYLGFDALLSFGPSGFRFLVDVFGGAAIRRNGKVILGADIFIMLTGPGRWHAWGYAEVHFLGTHRIPVDLAVGTAPRLPAPPPGDPLGDLAAAAGDPRNWSAQLPAAGEALVTLREVPAAAVSGVLAHPFGELAFRQRTVPLAVDITRYAGAPAPDDGRRLDLSFAVASGSVSGRREVRDAFPPGQFFDLSDDEKLSRPAFEQLVAGYAGLTPTATTSGTAVAGGDDYETVVVDAADPSPRPVGTYLPDRRVLATLTQTTAAAKAPRRNEGASQYAGPALGVALADPAYLVVSTATMTGPGPGYPSYTEAAAARDAAEPGAQVVGAHEVAVS
jgi:uncharacterized protein DUF6603